jgi:hypothetical protein
MAKVPVMSIQFESPPHTGLRGRISGAYSFEVPTFPSYCVCCNADPHGRTQSYNASTDRVTVPSIEIPVCHACSGHALRTHTGPIIMGSLLCVGIAVTALGFMYRGKSGASSGMIVAGFVLVALAILWIVVVTRRELRERTPGHHPHLVFAVAYGKTFLHTKNQALADELIALNPKARLIKNKVPKAQVV